MLRTTANPTPAAKEKTQKPKAKNALARKACFLETRVWEKILNCWRCAFFNSAASCTSARENAFRYDGVASGSIIYTYVGGNPISLVDPLGLWAWVFNAGAHGWAFPYPGAIGGSASSSWVPGGSVNQATSSTAFEVTTGELWDVDVSAGIGGLSHCSNGKPWSINFGPLGKYGGIQLNFVGDQFDGITAGIGLGLSLPITVTTPGR